MIRSIFLTTVITLSLFSAIVYTGCVDKCASITCQNGVSCSDGVCKCPTGYSGTHCETKPCVTNNTAQIRFTNKSVTNQTYTVLLDGSTITTLAPGTTSDYFTVAAGDHTFLFKISNTGEAACTQGTPNLAQCSYSDYSCNK